MERPVIAPVFDPVAWGHPAPASDAATPAVAGGTLRFADLLIDEPPRVALPVGTLLPPVETVAVPLCLDAQEAEPVRDHHARLFNQDGFFGRADMGTAVAAPIAAAVAPVGSPVRDEAVPAVRCPASAQEAVTVAPLLSSSAPLPPVPAGPAIRAIPVRTEMAPQTSAPRVVKDAPIRSHEGSVARRDAPSVARAFDRRVRPPTASVAVAVHMLGRGVEIAAQVAGLDPSERVRLADEIAALLSAHGFAPARIAIIAAGAGPADKEHR